MNYATTNIGVLADSKGYAQEIIDAECDRVNIPRRKVEFKGYSTFSNTSRKTKEWVARP